jgi:hypothetical protein
MCNYFGCIVPEVSFYHINCSEFFILTHHIPGIITHGGRGEREKVT